MRTNDRIIVLATEQLGLIVGWRRDGHAVVHLDEGEGVEPFHPQELGVTLHFSASAIDALQNTGGLPSPDWPGCVD